jgi:preprotein translocase subunit SecG
MREGESCSSKEFGGIMNKLYNVLAVVLAVVWTLFIITMVNLIGTKEKRLINQIAIGQARSVFQIMIDMRSWTAKQGGVYVTPTEETPPNPYLDHPRRDIQTTDGEPLTLINPSYMTRQVSEIGLERRGVKTHLTSLRPIRPENAAEGWEKEALESFETGESDYFELTQDKKGEYLFRYMKPLPLEEPCNSCHIPSHSAMGIRGGISISFPVQALVKSRTHVMRLNRMAFVSIWLVGLFAIGSLTLVLEKLYPGKGKNRF